jgi:hypothetical protein
MPLPIDGVRTSADPVRGLENYAFEAPRPCVSSCRDSGGTRADDREIDHSTVTLFARLRG